MKDNLSTQETPVTQPEAATATQSVPNFRGTKDFKSDNVKNTTATSMLVNFKI